MDEPRGLGRPVPEHASGAGGARASAAPARRPSPLRSRLPAAPAAGPGDDAPHAEAVAGGRAAQVYVAAWPGALDRPPVFAVRIAGTVYVSTRAATVEERPAGAAELTADWHHVGSSTATPEAVRTFANAFRVAPRMLRGADGTPQSFAVRLLQHVGLGSRLAPLLPLLERFPSSPRCPWLAEVRRAEADEEEPERPQRGPPMQLPPPPVLPPQVQLAQARERQAAAAAAVDAAWERAKHCEDELRAASAREKALLDASEIPWGPPVRERVATNDTNVVYRVTRSRNFSSGRARLEEVRARLKRAYDDHVRSLPRARPEECEAIFAAAVPAAATLLPDPVFVSEECEPRPWPTSTYLKKFVDCFTA
eukprot:tig00020875_g14896.t1